MFTNLIRFQREPLSVGAGTAIAAGLSTLSAGGQIYAAGKMNRKTRQWNEAMYGRQRADALHDWEMQNAYNSPAQQMQRLREAGLNPHLVYENGATHSAQAVRSSDAPSWNPETPDVSGLARGAIQGISAYQDYTIQQETVKNMQAQRRNMEIDAALKAINVTKGLIDNSRSSLEYQKALQTYDTSIATLEANLRNMEVSTDIKVSEEARKAALHAPNLAAAIQGVANAQGTGKLISQQLQNAKTRNLLDTLEVDLRKNGMSYSDPLVVRLIAKFVSSMSGGKSLPELAKALSDAIFKEGDVYEEAGDSNLGTFKRDTIKSKKSH